jgi:TPR repeat protein
MNMEMDQVHKNQATVWAQKAIIDGDAASQFNFAMMFVNGLGVVKNSQLAATWFRKAADQGHAVAQFKLSTMLAKGEGLPRDDRQAYFWVLLASSKLTGVAPVHAEMESRLTSGERSVVEAKARNWHCLTT